MNERRETNCLLEAEHVTVRFQDGGEVLALSNVTLKVGRGEFICVVGPSGSGKTTLLHVLSGIELPAEGTVRFMGRALHTLSERERTRLRLHHMGFVFQAYNLIPTLTAYENVDIVLSALGVDVRERRQRITELFEMLGIGSLMKRFPHEMSGGQQQRVAVIRAIAHRPPVIFADEPTANLDGETASHLMDTFQQLRETYSTTFLITTHDPRIMERAYRVIELIDGRIRSDKVRKEMSVQKS